MRPNEKIFPILGDFDNDGRLILADLIRKSAWGSLEQALASLTVFANPDVVKSLGSRSVFCTIRGGIRGNIKDHVMFDDNTSPQIAFKWSTGFKPRSDLQCNHLYTDSKKASAYTDVRNICYTPSFIAKLTDSQKKNPPADHLSHVLRFRAFELYGYSGPRELEIPSRPTGYDALIWPDPIGQTKTSEQMAEFFRKKLAMNTKHRLAKAVRLIGWTFSDYQPDGNVVYSGPL